MCAGLDPVNLRWKCGLCLGALKHKHIEEIEKKIDKVGGSEKYWLMDQDSTDEEHGEEELEDFSDSEVFEKCFKGNDTKIWSAITSICKIDLKKINLDKTKIANKDDVFVRKAVTNATVKTEFEEKVVEEYLDAFNCDECNFDCDSEEGLNRHMKLHDPNREFACDECGLRFLKERHVSIHARIHTGEKPFRCDLCTNSFAESWSLKLHMSKHDPRRKFGCSYCSLRFKSSTALEVHVEKQHGVIKEEPVEDKYSGSNHENGDNNSYDENELDQPSSSGYFGEGKPTSAGLAWLDSVKQESGRLNSSDFDSQDSCDGGERRLGSQSTSRERTSSPNIENVGWRRTKPTIKIYHPRTRKLKCSPENLDHNYSSGSDEKHSKDIQRPRKVSREFLESKEDLVEPFALKIKKSNRSWLDERSVSSSDEDSDNSAKRLRLHLSEDSNEMADFQDDHRSFSEDDDRREKKEDQYGQNYDDEHRRSNRGSNVRASLDDDDKVWCHKMTITSEEDGIDPDNNDVESPVSPASFNVEVIDLLSASDEEEQVISKDESESDDFSIKSDEPPDPIDDLLVDSGSESDSKSPCPEITTKSKTHVTDHDYVKEDNSGDETCSENDDQ